MFLKRCLVATMWLGCAGAWGQSCEEIVADTVMEMRAGTPGPWSEEQESLVRAAAGSACVKAISGRYATATRESGDSKDEPVAAATGAVEVDTRSSTSAAPAAEDDDDGFSIGGIRIRGQSGSVNRKSYERVRDSRDDG